MNAPEVIDFREGEVVLSVRVEPQSETVWLNRQQMAQLFEQDVKTIGKHIQAALREELDVSTVAKFATVQQEGERRVSRIVLGWGKGDCRPHISCYGGHDCRIQAEGERNHGETSDELPSRLKRYTVKFS